MDCIKLLVVIEIKICWSEFLHKIEVIFRKTMYVKYISGYIIKFNTNKKLYNSGF